MPVFSWRKDAAPNAIYKEVLFDASAATLKSLPGEQAVLEMVRAGAVPESLNVNSSATRYKKTVSSIVENEQRITRQGPNRK
jgi:hypothetical protein